MVKKLCALLLILMLPLSALAAEQRVFDNSGLFNAIEEAALEAQITQMRQTYPMDFVVLTDDGVEYSSDDDEAEKLSLRYVDQFYAQGGFGAGEEESGFVYFIDMSNRIPTVYTYGAMSDYVDDERLSQMLDAVYNYLYEAEYAGSAAKALELANSYLQAGIPEGQYRYDVITGQRLTARHKALTSGEIVGAFIVGLVIAGLTAMGVTRSYKLKGGAYSYNVDGNSAVEMLDSEDVYLNSTVSSVRRPKNTSGGHGGGSRPSGGTRIHSSGGRSFGGGSGRRF
ncbi:MAG: TPM domain-containing protein [Clostridia bacterium]|nr:TPM domain-containing protein [Clostridia bacterium]